MVLITTDRPHWQLSIVRTHKKKKKKREKIPTKQTLASVADPVQSGDCAAQNVFGQRKPETVPVRHFTTGRASKALLHLAGSVQALRRLLAA